MECDLGEWSDWSSPALAPEQCGKEKRTREYIAKEKFSFGETCDGIVTSCPAAKDETRTICKFIVFVKKKFVYLADELHLSSKYIYTPPI